MKFPEELSASPAARGFTLLRVRHILGRFGQAARVAPGRHLIPSLPIGHRHTTPDPGPYAPTFPPNRWLMPAHTGESRSGGPVTVDGMRIHVVDHPLVAHKLTTLRDQRTESPTFRRLADELVTLLAYEATRDVRTEQVDIVTPVTATTGVRLSHPRPLVVPILRAGLGMLPGVLDMIPSAKVSVVGMQRDEHTLEPVAYYEKLSGRMDQRMALIVDPMLATAGTLVAAVDMLKAAGCKRIKGLFLVAAPEGLKRIEATHPDIEIYTASIDERLNEHGYILPGLGDAGDKIFGTKQLPANS